MTRIEEAKQKFGADDNIAKVFKLGIFDSIINDDAWLCLTTNEQARLLKRITQTIDDHAPILLK